MACKRCGGEHFNFVRCEDYELKLAEQKLRERSPETFLRPREGERFFGNRLLESEVNKANPNVVYIPRKQHPHYQGD